MKRKMALLASLAAFLFVLAGTGLAQKLMTTINPLPDPCAVQWDLVTGSGVYPGMVRVTNDVNNIYVTFALWYYGEIPPESQRFFGNLHLWIGNDLFNMPANSQGFPAADQFCSALGGKCFDATGLMSYTAVIPFSEVNLVDAFKSCGAKLIVLALAEVDMDGNPSTPGYEVAYGGDRIVYGAPSYIRSGDQNPPYWFYGEYTICCNGFTPPTPCYKTAFAKGGWVWTTEGKSNPEGLPSLRLIKNRWGWAINLTVPGTATYDIYAGAGLNDINKGVRVGTLDVVWNGTQASVKYTMIAGYRIQEIHIYAGDKRPTTTAPGQYGYVDSFGPSGVDSLGPIEFTVSDSNGDGIWLIAHAIVAVPCPK